MCEVILSSLSVRRPQQFGACWLGIRLWQELKLDEFFGAALQDRHGTIQWAKVIELLTVIGFVTPRVNWRSSTLIWDDGHGCGVGYRGCGCGQGSTLPGTG